MIGADLTPLGEAPGPFGPPGRHQTIGVVMCVKDEKTVIERCLQSVRSHIDRWTVCDTGSTDQTPQIIARALDGIPGQLWHRPWRNFGYNRTEAVSLAKGSADYLLVMDADMTLAAGPLPKLEADAYNLSVTDRSGFGYRLPALIRGDVDWHYEGVTHECLAGNGYPKTPAVPLNEWILHHHCDGTRRPDKLNDDLQLLTQAVHEHPLDARSVFYLAQTMRDLGLNQQAADMYERRINLAGWDEEVWYAQYQKGVCQLRAGRWYDGRMTLLAAWHRRPHRAEPLYALAKSILPPADDLLFIEPDCYGTPP